MDFLTNGAPDFDPRDVADNKTISGLCYIPILFFLPLICCPSSYFGRYNANQSLLLLMAEIIITGVLSMLSKIFFIGWIFGIASFIAGIALFILFLLCLVLTIDGKAVKLPVIGDITLIK